MGMAQGKYTDLDGVKFMGEHNSKNKLHGLGMCVYFSCNLRIGHWNNGVEAPGIQVGIMTDGRFIVSENYYDENGVKKEKGTIFWLDGRRQRLGNI